MSRFREMFQWQTISGKPVTAGDLTVTPQSRVLVVRSPYGGWVWNRPVAVQVAQANRPGTGPARIPIVDVTRLAQLGLWGLSLIFSIITLFLLIQQRRA
jgi:hypothetical protein